MNTKPTYQYKDMGPAKLFSIPIAGPVLLYRKTWGNIMPKVHVFFLGYQECGEFGPPMALFNVIERGDKSRTTVSRQTLEKIGLPVPDYPGFDEWKRRELMMQQGVEAWITAENWKVILRGKK